MRLRPWQQDIIKKIYDNPAGTRRAIISFGRKNGKGLALDTPIPTPNGWRSMGSLDVGDLVYGTDGRPTEVLFVSETHTDLRCWRLTFSDGSSIVADEQHRWLTNHRYRPWAITRRNGSGNGGRRRKDVVTTPQIAESVLVKRNDGGKEHNHKITCALALESEDVALPVDPYVLGAWLGDGTTACATFTVSDGDSGHLKAQLESSLGGVHFTRNGERALTLRTPGTGLQSALRALGVLGNKHIPESYLVAGTNQRWALLQGLMDTDGTVGKNGGGCPRASFNGTNERLCEQVWRLARSLGLKATIKASDAKLYGRVTGRQYDVAFTAKRSEPIFRLERKQELLSEKIGTRSRTLAIVSCEEIESVPTRCITVAAADSLFLAGYGCVPTHNTALAALLLMLHLAGPEAKANSQLVSAAQSKEQAAVLFALAAKIVRMSPELMQYVGIRDTNKQLYCQELGTLYKALSAEASTAYGLSPVFAVHDELGQVKGQKSELYTAIETASGAHDDPLSIAISTQAATDNDLFSRLIDDAKTGRDPRTVLSLYTSDLEADPFSEESIRSANPAFGDFQNSVEVLDMAEIAKAMPSAEAEYRNLILNQRVELNTPFITKSIWTACGSEVVESFAGLPVFMGLDLSEVNDLTALVAIAPVNGIWHVKPTFWLPGVGMTERARKDRVPWDIWANNGFLNAIEGAKSVEYEFVAHHLREICNACDVRKIAFDRWNFRHLKPWLVKVGFSEEDIEARFVEFGQGYVSMSPALRSLESMILNGKIAHGMHPVLTKCASDAIATPDAAGNKKLDKVRSRGRIDGMIALAMAVGAAGEYIDSPVDELEKAILARGGLA